MHYFCSHVHGMHIINSHRRHANHARTLTLKRIVRIWTSSGPSIDWLLKWIDMWTFKCTRYLTIYIKCSGRTYISSSYIHYPCINYYRATYVYWTENRLISWYIPPNTCPQYIDIVMSQRAQNTYLKICQKPIAATTFEAELHNKDSWQLFLPCKTTSIVPIICTKECKERETKFDILAKVSEPSFKLLDFVTLF